MIDVNKNFKKIAVPGLLLLSAGALYYAFRPVRIPSYADVVGNFDPAKYAGHWYEIARFDFKHERNLKNVTACYSLNEDGSIKVVNRGYNMKTGEWQEAVGKAKSNGDPTQGALKVSFFGPFYSGYNVVMMSPDYQTALVFGESRDYLWILSRERNISAATKKKFLQKAQDAGYDLDRLVWTEHDDVAPAPEHVQREHSKPSTPRPSSSAAN